MLASSTAVQNNFGKYLDLSAEEEIIITKNGTPVARLLGVKKAVTFLADSLVGIIPADIDEDEIKKERLSKC